MNLCFLCHFKGRLFNWITVLLVTAWVVVVGVLAEFVAKEPRLDAMADDGAAFVETLVR